MQETMLWYEMQFSNFPDGTVDGIYPTIYIQGLIHPRCAGYSIFGANLYGRPPATLYSQTPAFCSGFALKISWHRKRSENHVVKHQWHPKFPPSGGFHLFFTLKSPNRPGSHRTSSSSSDPAIEVENPWKSSLLKLQRAMVLLLAMLSVGLGSTLHDENT